MAQVKPVPDGYTTVTPYLFVDGGAKAIEFYKKAFGAEERMRMPGPDGKLMHAEIQIGNSVIMLADAMPAPSETRDPRALKGTSVSILLYVDDVDAWAKRAQAAGIKVVRPVEDQFYGDRAGTFEDPFGHYWDIHTNIEEVSPEEMEKRMAAMAPA
jgi:PhnB protein